MWRLESNAFNRRGSPAICIASIMHLANAYLIVFYPLSVGATNILALQQWAAFGGPVFLIVAEIIVSVALALYGTLFRVGWPRIVLLLPQQYLLSVMAYGGVAATVAGRYLDGTLIPNSHILNDQLGYVALFAIHFDAIIRRTRDA